MNNIVNWFTKKKLAVIGLFGSIVFLMFIFININVPVDVCYYRGFCGHISEALTIYFLLFVPMFIFSLIIYKLKSAVFITWRNFSMWAVPISLIIITFLPRETLSPDSFLITKGTVIFSLTILYSTISLFIIMDEWFTKKKMFVFSLIGVFVFFYGYFFDISIQQDVCYMGEFCGDVSEILRIYFLPFLSIFVFLIATYKLKESTFHYWRNFSIWFITLSLVLITFLPTRTHGLDFIPITKGTIILVLTILYSIISLIIIIYQSFKKE